MASSYLLNHKHLLKHAKTYNERLQDQKAKIRVQQGDYLKEFMLKIVNDGLASAYEIYGKNPPGPPHPTKAAANSVLPDVQSDVIIVGAGVAGARVEKSGANCEHFGANGTFWWENIQLSTRSWFIWGRWEIYLN